MRRRNPVDNSKWSPSCGTLVFLLVVTSISCVIAYAFFSPFFAGLSKFTPQSLSKERSAILADRAACCRGVEHLEYWGRVVEWGNKLFTNTSLECCQECRKRCLEDGDCECNSWVYCSDKEKCGSRFQECWLKSQEDALAPDIQASGKNVMWTSGMLYGKDTGVLGIQTSQGTIRIKLLVDCAPLSVAYILELLKQRHCAGCHFYRVEGRGSSWNEDGELVGLSTTGPYGLVQGSLAIQTDGFKQLRKEACPLVEQGSVGWIDGGPDFFISLVDHYEWYPKQTVFARVLPEDMPMVEELATLPTLSSTWSGVKVTLLQELLPFKIVKPALTTSVGVTSG